MTKSRNKREGYYAMRTPAYILDEGFFIVRVQRHHRRRKHWRLGKGLVDRIDDGFEWTSYEPPCKESP